MDENARTLDSKGRNTMRQSYGNSNLSPMSNNNKKRSMIQLDMTPQTQASKSKVIKSVNPFQKIVLSKIQSLSNNKIPEGYLKNPSKVSIFSEFYPLKKWGEIIQGRKQYKRGYYTRKYGMSTRNSLIR